MELSLFPRLELPSTKVARKQSVSRERHAATYFCEFVDWISMNTTYTGKDKGFGKGFDGKGDKGGFGKGGFDKGFDKGGFGKGGFDKGGKGFGDKGGKGYGTHIFSVQRSGE